MHNDYGDARKAATRVQQVFGATIDSLTSILIDLKANFNGAHAQGTRAYVDQITQDRPELDAASAAADCQLAVEIFCNALVNGDSPQ